MDSAARPSRSELSVTEVTRMVKGLIEGEPRLTQVWVRGEVSNARLIPSGHLYFTLKDEGAELRVAFFGYGRRRTKAPADGEALLVHGDMRVYEKRGEYQLVADDLLKAGKGDLAARFEALKQKLSDEGLFDQERKVELPAVPKRIAIVTGAATAALQDVLNILRRRAPYAEVVLFHAPVQGDTAPPEIVSALRSADACPGIEAILLVRGGGSIEDLWCFNDEALARALAEVTRPVITGVGHEVDFTIVDFIADHRAPTPSAAAELVCPDAAELRGAVDDRTRRLLRNALGEVTDAGERLTRLFDRRLIRDVVGELDSRVQGLDDLGLGLAESGVDAVKLGEDVPFAREVDDMARRVARSLGDAKHALPQAREGLLRGARNAITEQHNSVSALDKHLKAIDPRAPKKLGFSLVWDSKGNIIRDADSVSTGENIRVELQKGEFTAKKSEDS